MHIYRLVYKYISTVPYTHIVHYHIIHKPYLPEITPKTKPYSNPVTNIQP
jgi:hypothetical protein